MNVAVKSLSTAVYVRVSTEEQAQEGFSVRGQTDKLKAYALLKEWDIYDIYADEGISGKNLVDRPAINRLIDDIKSRKVNNVLVFKVDRLTRNTKNLLELVELFNQHDCAFNSLTESIDTQTASGRMFLKIIGIFAEFERENIIERIKVGCERKVREGYTLATHISAYGYNREKGQKVQNIHPDESEIVKEIFTMYVEKNIPINRIAKMLNERKIPTKLNSKWESTTVKCILVNPTYIGKVRYAMEDESRYFVADGQHEPIISDELFELTQAKIKNTSRTVRTKRPREESYFCGILYCGVCGSKHTTHNYVRKAYNGEQQYNSSYLCQKKKSCSKDVVCKSHDICHEKMEIAFCEYIQNINDISGNNDTEIETANKNLEQAEQDLLKSIVTCEKKMADLHSRKNQFMEQYVQGDL
ncbi:MAG: recombinase family protein, partial [Oscillospiraceae bacterium]|nr:recombinase family protein [Oscillospiraceae bacterium]